MVEPERGVTVTRRLSLTVLTVQAGLLAVLVSLLTGDHASQAEMEKAQALFKFAAIAFVVLSPFGLLSTLFSICFVVLKKVRPIGVELERRSRENYPEMFFVWRECRRNTMYEGNDLK